MAQAQAQEQTLYLMEVPPMTMNEPERKGVVGDLSLEALRRAGYASRLVVEPSNRAMASVQAGHDLLIIPLARTTDRESHYTWIAPLARVQRAFFTLQAPAADSLAQARSRYKRVAVARGSAGVVLLLEAGFTREQLVEVTQGDTAPKMLLLERVDAWFNPIGEAQLLLAQQEGGVRVRMGAPLAPTHNYLACSKSCDPQLVERLRAALAEMEADGTARAIRQRY